MGLNEGLNMKNRVGWSVGMMGGAEHEKSSIVEELGLGLVVCI
jgi:hypothetical protein